MVIINSYFLQRNKKILFISSIFPNIADHKERK